MGVRRGFAILLALLFIITFIPLLVFFRINNTAGSPRFYAAQLEQSGAYTVVYDEILPSAVAQVYDNMGETAIDISVLEPHTVSMVAGAFPPDWLQAQVELAVNSVLPYTLGTTDSFRFHIDLEDRAKVLAGELKETLHREEVFSELYEQFVDLALVDYPSGLNQLSLKEAQVRSIITGAFPAHWFMDRIDEIIDEMLPYLTGDAEGFSVRLDISDRTEALEAAVVDVLKDAEFYDYLIEELLVPALAQNIGDITQVSDDATLTGEEITGVTRDIFTLEWYRARVSEITGQVFDYLNGINDDLVINLPLDDRKPVAAGVLSELINEKAGRDISALTLPVLDKVLDVFVPDRLILNDLVWGDSGSGEALTDLREFIDRGIIYTELDLMVTLGPDFERVENIRQRIDEGLVFTEEDLQGWVAGTDAGDSRLQSFDNVRHLIRTLRNWVMPAWLVPAVLLAGVSALAARRWVYKLVWGAGVLAVACLLAAILCGPVFSSFVQPRFGEALSRAADSSSGYQALLYAEGASLVEDAAGVIAGGIVLQALILLGIAAVFIVTLIVWHKTRITDHDPAGPRDRNAAG